MSWSLTVSSTPKAEFDAAVDAAVPSGQEADLPGMAEDVATVKAALKAMAPHVKRSMVTGNGGGHCLQEGEGPNWSDGLVASVNGSEPKE